jgi:hypothetical protein
MKTHKGINEDTPERPTHKEYIVGGHPLEMKGRLPKVLV